MFIGSNKFKIPRVYSESINVDIDHGMFQFQNKTVIATNFFIL